MSLDDDGPDFWRCPTCGGHERAAYCWACAPKGPPIPYNPPPRRVPVCEHCGAPETHDLMGVRECDCDAPDEMTHRLRRRAVQELRDIEHPLPEHFR